MRSVNSNGANAVERPPKMSFAESDVDRPGGDGDHHAQVNASGAHSQPKAPGAPTGLRKQCE